LKPSPPWAYWENVIATEDAVARIDPEWFARAYRKRCQLIRRAKGNGWSDTDAEMLACKAFGYVLTDVVHEAKTGKPYTKTLGGIRKRMNTAMSKAVSEYLEHRTTEKYGSEFGTAAIVRVINSDPEDDETDEEQLDRVSYREQQAREHGLRTEPLPAAENWYAHVGRCAGCSDCR